MPLKTVAGGSPKGLLGYLGGFFMGEEWMLWVAIILSILLIIEVVAMLICSDM